MLLLKIVGGAMIALLIFGTAYKYWEVRKASHWLRTQGKVLSAKAVARRVRTAETRRGAAAGADLNVRNFAEVRYEYRVNGKRFTGNRISLGEDLGDFMVAETLARYPEGKRVIVHYDPAQPDRAVLEHGAPDGIWRTMIIFIGVLVVLFVGGTAGFDRVVQVLQDRLAQPQRAVPVAALAGLAVFLGLLGWALRRQVEQAREWLTTQGQVLSSGVERFASRESKMNPSSTDGVISSRWQLLVRPDVAYRYTVDGVEYQGNRISFGGRLYASFDLLARRRVSAYGKSQAVTVHYNPANAAEAVLEVRAYGEWVVWLLAALLAATAAGLALT
jgi:hypothetical protein